MALRESDAEHTTGHFLGGTGPAPRLKNSFHNSQNVLTSWGKSGTKLTLVPDLDYKFILNMTHKCFFFLFPEMNRENFSFLVTQIYLTDYILSQLPSCLQAQFSIRIY